MPGYPLSIKNVSDTYRENRNDRLNAIWYGAMYQKMLITAQRRVNTPHRKREDSFPAARRTCSISNINQLKRDYEAAKKEYEGPEAAEAGNVQPEGLKKNEEKNGPAAGPQMGG